MDSLWHFVWCWAVACPVFLLGTIGQHHHNLQVWSFGLVLYQVSPLLFFFFCLCCLWTFLVGGFLFSSLEFQWVCQNLTGWCLLFRDFSCWGCPFSSLEFQGVCQNLRACCLLFWVFFYWGCFLFSLKSQGVFQSLQIYSLLFYAFSCWGYHFSSLDSHHSFLEMLLLTLIHVLKPIRSFPWFKNKKFRVIIFYLYHNVEQKSLCSIFCS